MTILVQRCKSERDKREPTDYITARYVQGYCCTWNAGWDRHIPGGRPYDEVIEQEISSAKCAVVLWSKESVTSRWVKTEAAEGAQREILVPVLIEQAKLPLEFNRIQTVDLSAWDRK